MKTATCYARGWLLLVALLVLEILPTTGWATAKSTPFNVTVTIVDDCNIVSVTNISMSLGVVGAGLSNSGTITVNCTPGTAYTIGMDAGTANGSTIANRLLQGGSAQLKFNLYRDAAKTQVLGNTAGVDTMGVTGSGTNQVTTFYWQIPSQTTPPPGTYVTTITTTVNY